MEVIKKNTGYVYCKDGFVYIKNGGRNLRCYQHREHHCGGTAKLSEEGDTLEHRKQHSHSNDDSEVKKIHLKAGLKRYGNLCFRLLCHGKWMSDVKRQHLQHLTAFTWKGHHYFLHSSWAREDEW